MTRTERLVMALAAAAISGACGGEKATDDESGKAPDKAVPIGDFRKQQEKYADSILNLVSAPSQVVEKLGKGYAVGSTRMRDTIAFLSQQANCFPKARLTDPYLAGTVTYWVNMNAIGSDVIEVNEPQSKWTSPAGNLVTACLNQAARKWKLNDSFGKPAGYVVQVQFRSSDVRAADSVAAAAAKAKGGGKSAPAKPPETATKKKS